jgi:hypothetical protein
MIIRGMKCVTVNFVKTLALIPAFSPKEKVKAYSTFGQIERALKTESAWRDLQWQRENFPEPVRRKSSPGGEDTGEGER